MSELSNYGSITSERPLVELEDKGTQNRICPVNSPSNKKRYFSLLIACILMHNYLMQYIIYNPSLWPYLTQMDQSVTEVFYGIVMMGFNIASALSSPIYGLWYHRRGSTKEPLIASNFLTIAGSLLLMFTEAFPSNRKYVILASRCISGCGHGCYGILYAYLAMATTFEERNYAMTFRSVMNGAALFTGPAIQAIFSYIGYPALAYWPFYLNMYTASSLFNVIVNIIQIIVIIVIFKEHIIIKEGVEIDSNKITAHYDKIAAFVCIIVEGIIMFCLSYSPGVHLPLSMLMFGWSRKEAIYYNGIIQASCGALDPIGTIFAGLFLLKFMKERTLIAVGLLFLILYFLFPFPWPNLPPLVPIDGLQNQLANISDCSYIWCDYTTRIYLWQYILGYLCAPLTLVAAYSQNINLFSKILRPNKQGIPQGIFAAVSCAGEALGTVISTSVFYYYGPRVTFIIGSLTVLVGLLAVVLTFKRLIPHRLFLSKQR